MFAFFVIPKGKIIIIVIIMITYLMLRRLLCVDILNFLFLVGIAAHKSWIEPIGQIQPQNIRFVSNNTKINTAKRKKGKTPCAMEKKIYSRIPDPSDKGFRGEFNIGSTFTIPSKPMRLIGKIISRII